MTPHILIVEDDTSMRDVIAFFLQEEGYQVTQAHSGEAAIELLLQAASHGVSYDVVLSDIVLGAVDGIEVMNVARNLPDEPTVLLLTGHGSLETAIAAVRAGAFDYLLKPCDLDTLLRCVEAASHDRYERLRMERDAETGRKFLNFVSQFAQPEVERGKEEQEGKSEPPPHKDQPSHEEQPVSPPGERYLRVGHLCIDTYRYEVSLRGQHVHVSPTEYAILAYLATFPGQVATFYDIARNTRTYHVEEAEARDLIRGPVRSLRKKLDRRSLVSVRGIEFMLIDPDEG